MLTYKQSGVDKEEGYRTVDIIKEMVKKTYSKNVLNELGGFAGLYELGQYKNPVLVSGTDGVGTKLKLAFEVEIFDSIGIDCVAMCVNDILCHGAKPLFFLDYLACGKLNADKASLIVKGITNGCMEAGAALIGGETAEMPGFYQNGEYDLAGFAVGIVEKEDIVNGSAIKEGDLIIALPSSGFHSNGFSLIRRLVTNLELEFNGIKLGDLLLTPTKIYVQPVLEILSRHQVHGMAHITGGGIIENLPRIIPKGMCAYVSKHHIHTPPLFHFIQSLGISEEEMWGTFNMGIGFLLVVNEESVASVLSILKIYGSEGSVIGYIGTGGNRLCLR